VGDEHRADGFLPPLAWLVEQRLQHAVSCRKKVVKQTSMRQQRLDRVEVSWRKRLRGEPIQSFRDLARRRGRRIERQLEYSGCERAYCGGQRVIPVCLEKSGSEQPKVT